MLRLEEWEDACEALSKALLRDLGYLGVDMGSLRGFYSDSLTESAMTGRCSDTQHTTNTACTGASKTWTPDQGFALPCRTSEESTDAVVVRDAVHVALAANWQDAGWAAAQVWPDGLPMAAESIGRLSQRDRAATAPVCGKQLVLLDTQGRPVWAGLDPAPDQGSWLSRWGAPRCRAEPVGLGCGLWVRSPSQLTGSSTRSGPTTPHLLPRLVVEGLVAGGDGRRRRVLAPGPALGAAVRRGRCRWSWCCWCRCWCC